jgi:hypothetical protein
VSPREANSITENTPFLSTSGASANFLHIDPTIPSYAESGAVNIAGITNDFDGQTRQGNTGYSGLGTAPDMGADEFEQNLPPCSGASSGSITATSFSSCAGQHLSLFSVNYSMGSGTTYQWQVGTTPGGPYSNVGGANGNHHAYTSSSHSAGVYYFVMVTTCSVGPVSAVSNEVSYTVQVSPTASITAPVSVCNGGTITLAGSSDAATGYSWTGPNSFSSTSQNTVINSAGLTAGGQYSLVTTLGQCSSPVSVFSVIVSQATVNLVNPSPSLCYGNSTTLTAVGETGASYNWSSGPTSASISVAPLVNTVYDVTVTNVYNCTVAATTSITVVNVTIAAQGTSVCPNVTGTLSVDSYTPAFINWYASSTSTTSIGTGSSYAMSAPTNSTVYAEARSGKADSLFTSVAGTSSFLGEMFDVVPLKTMTIKGLDAQFAVGSGTIEIWYRYGTHVGNTSSNTGWTMAASVTLTSAGTLTLTTIPATLNIPAVAGQTVAFYIVANTGPNVRYSSGGTLSAVYVANNDLQILYGTTGNTYFNATASPRAFNGQVRYEIPGCTSPRVPVTLTVNPLPSVTIAQNTTAVCYSTTASFTASGASTYTWVNGPVSSTFSSTPTTATTYTVNGTSLAGCTNSATASVTINALPVITVAQSSAAVCYSTPVTFTASGASTYSWANGPTSATFSDNPVSASVYTVAGTAANGCSASVTASVGVNPLPVLLVTQSAGTVCATNPVTFTVSGAGTYTWNTTSNDSVMVDYPASAAFYTVSGTNSFGCESSVTASVGVNPLPTVVISQSSPSVCANSALSFTATGAGQYLWSTGAITNTMVLTPASNTFVTVTGTDANGCYAKDSVGVSVSPLPTVSIAQSASSVCLGASATFTASGAGTYSWSSGSQVSTESVIPTAYTVYTVTGTLPTGCAATATAELHTLALPAVAVTADRDTICENESTELEATGAVSYAWLPSGGTGATLPVTPASTTIYTVTGTGANNCENIATVTVVVDPCTGLSKNAAADGTMRLYPNPTSGLLNLEFSVEGVREIRVLNAVGQVILEKTSAQAVETIDLGAYARGFYYVHVKGREGERTFRVITQN